MLLDLLFVFTALYTIQILLFAIGVRNATYSSDPSSRPTVSIIIAARNEEKNLRACLESISQLTYPTERLEVVVVNDRSTDGTEEIIGEFARRCSFIKLLNATEDVSGRLHGKTNAITQGIEHSNGEILLFTDADCVVQRSWVEETVKYYDQPSVGLVAGFTALRSRTMFEALQALDWFVLFSIAAGTIRLRFPVTAVGNNLSVLRAAYDAVGGYRSIPFSVTEDYALFHAVTKKTNYDVRFPLDPRTLVFSLPCETWRELFNQKKRWFTGGAGMDWKRIAMFALGFTFKALLGLTLAAGQFAAFLAAFALKSATDAMVVAPALKAFKARRLFLYLLPFELYYTAYVLLFPPLVLFNRDVRWKDRHLR